MSQEELNALIALLNRCPMTPAEMLWLQALLQRLQKVNQESDIPVVCNAP
jgi:hypothetical protein